MWVLEMVANARRSNDEAVRGIVWIGHGLGGLIIKHALRIAAHEPIYLPMVLRTQTLVEPSISLTADAEWANVRV